MPALVVEIHILDEYLTIGEWCHHCLLPSAVRIPFVAVDETNLRTVMRAASLCCQECGRHWNERT